MAKDRIRFICGNCGHDSPKWQGVCPSCNEWNTFSEQKVVKPTGEKNRISITDSEKLSVTALSDVTISDSDRFSTNLTEFDRVLNGGFVRGSFSLLGGDPGIGKSTLMLQVKNLHHK